MLISCRNEDEVRFDIIKYFSDYMNNVFLPSEIKIEKTIKGYLITIEEEEE